MYEEKSIDTRSLGEIWLSLSAQEKEDLRFALISAKTAKTRQAIHLWVTGKRNPGSEVLKDKVAQIVSKQIGKKVISRTLFPLS